MFPRKVPNTVLPTNHNLKNTILVNNSVINKYYFFRYNFALHEIAISNLLKNISNLRNTVQVFCEHGSVLRALQNHLRSVPHNLKNQSGGVLRVWARQCECVFAQRVRRGQQMFCLYTKLWEERALKELLTRMRQHITRRGKELMFSAIGVASYNWDCNRISNDDIIKYMDELDYIHLLTEKTVFCEICMKSNATTPKMCCECPNRTLPTKSYDDWMLFIEKKDMLVWRKLRDSGHYEYKVYGSFNDVTAEDFLKVQIDTEYRKQWDTTAIALEVIEKDPIPQTNSDVVYWEILWPKLFVNRDYVFHRRFKIDSKNNVIIIMSRGTKHPACPVRSDKYRVDEYWSYMVIKPYSDLNKPGIEFGLTYYDNPGVNIPSAVSTWVAMRAMPDFLSRLREATKDYKIYCERTGYNYHYNTLHEPTETGEEKFCEEIVTDNTIYEPQHPIKNRKTPFKINYHPTIEREKTKVVEGVNCIPSIIAADEIMTLPSPALQADPENQTYWKYLRLNYYFT